MKSPYIDKIEVYVDGCSKDNPGPSGAGSKKGTGTFFILISQISNLTSGS